MKREIKPLLLVGLDSEEYRQATAEADEKLGRWWKEDGQRRCRRRQGESGR